MDGRGELKDQIVRFINENAELYGRNAADATYRLVHVGKSGGSKVFRFVQSYRDLPVLLAVAGSIYQHMKAM